METPCNCLLRMCSYETVTGKRAGAQGQVDNNKWTKDKWTKDKWTKAKQPFMYLLIGTGSSRAVAKKPHKLKQKQNKNQKGT